MAEPPKKPAASRDPRLAYRPIVTTTPATTSVTTPPTSGGAPLVPPGYYHPTGDERGSRQAGEKSRRSSSSEDEDEPRKRRDTAKTPSPTGPEEGGGEEMASSSSASSSTSSSQASADYTAISCVGGRPGCLFHVTLKHQSQEALSRLYSHTELLYMPGVVIEGWRGVSGVAQCHRCQRFGHSSNNCHRAPKCVRCAEEHLSAECPRPRQDKPTCANCGRAHAACYKRCPLYLKEVRKRRASGPPPPPRGRKVAEKRPPRPTRAERRRAQAPLPPETAHPQLASTPAEIPQERGGGATLAVPANDPTDQHAPLPQRKKRHRAGRKHRRRAPIAAQEAGPRSSDAQRPASCANCANCGQKMPPTVPVVVHRQPAQVAPESDGQPTGRYTRRQQRSELAARPVVPTQPERRPLSNQPLPQRQPRSRTRRTATPAAPITTTTINAGGIDARDPLQIILQRLDRQCPAARCCTTSTILRRGWNTYNELASTQPGS
ncbi:hypothetical protein K1T71_014559 [Dendrolimus kikuchii]|uniref:Uncharacterized protein n=1 Tax=Dendrolimus kikuchii TaxID=765133 RepID=A0ACC1CEC9_9NEOP|nr:hypothetical protein K1T71_014559 [Dendrolimus kikuchii]